MQKSLLGYDSLTKLQNYKIVTELQKSTYQQRYKIKNDKPEPSKAKKNLQIVLAVRHSWPWWNRYQIMSIQIKLALVSGKKQGDT